MWSSAYVNQFADDLAPEGWSKTSRTAPPRPCGLCMHLYGHRSYRVIPTREYSRGQACGKLAAPYLEKLLIQTTYTEF